MSEPTPSLLSESQRRLVGIALSLAAAALIAALVCGSVFVLSRLLALFSGVLWPIAAAGILALILRPCVSLIERRLRLPRIAAVTLLFAAFLGGVTLLLILAIPPLVSQILDFVAYLPSLWHSATVYVDQHYPAWIETFRRHAENPALQRMSESIAVEAKMLLAQAVPSLKAAGGGVIVAASFITRLAIIPIYLFFFLLSRAESPSRIEGQLSFVGPQLRQDLVFLGGEFVAIVVSFFRGQLLIGLIMGALLALGFSIIGLKFGLFLGLTLGILNIVPYLGTIIGLIVAVPLALFQPGGGWQLVGLVLFVKVVVQAIEGWFLTPKIMGARTGLHPVVIIFALFFWGVALDGLLGMVLAIPLTAFVVTAWRLVKRKYLS